MAQPVERWLAAYNGVTDELLAFCDDHLVRGHDRRGGVAGGQPDGQRDGIPPTSPRRPGNTCWPSTAPIPRSLRWRHDGSGGNTVGGVASTLNLHRVCIFNQRVYYAEKDSSPFGICRSGSIRARSPSSISAPLHQGRQHRQDRDMDPRQRGGRRE